MVLRRFLPVLIAASALAGCGSDPYAGRLEQAERETRAELRGDTGVDAQPPREAPADPAPVPPAGPAPTADAALRDFALRFVNWSWQDPVGQQRVLAEMATGALERELRAAIGTAVTATRRTDRPSHSGSVEALQMRGGEGPRRDGIVVTRERSYRDGRADEGGLRWTVYLGSSERVVGGWKVSAWEAQP
jgi:hypothetical protein